MQNPLTNRTVTPTGLSVATGLAMESLFPSVTRFDPAREIPSNVDINKYAEFYINLETLFRNITTAANKDSVLRATPNQLLDILTSEIEILIGLFSNEGNGACRPIFYRCSHPIGIGNLIAYRCVKSSYKLLYNDMLEKTIELYKKSYGQIVEFKSRLSPKERNDSLLLSHRTEDLLSYPNFSSLDLLESHTGVLKQRRLYYTKFDKCGDDDLSNIPFNGVTLGAFGDRSVILPVSYRLRKQIVDCSKKRRWTALTSLDHFKLTLALDIPPDDCFSLLSFLK